MNTKKILIAMKAAAAPLVPPGDLDDVIQEAFARMWPRLSYARNVSAYAYKVARCAAYDHLRQRQRNRIDYSADVSDLQIAAPAAVSDALDVDERIALIPQILAKLTPAHRRALLLVAEGWSYQEIAGAEGINLGTVRSRVFNARRAACAALEA